MGELEDPQGHPDVLGADVATRGQRRGHGGRFVAELGLAGGQRRFVDRAREVGVQKAFLHRFDLGGALLVADALLALDVADIPERRLKRGAEPPGEIVVRDADSFQVRDNRVFEVVPSPADRGMRFVRQVVGAAVIFVNADPAVVQFPLDAFARDQRSAVLASEQAARERVIDFGPRPTDLAIQQILADRERSPINEGTVLARIVPLPPADVSHIDAVPQHA